MDEGDLMDLDDGIGDDQGDDFGMQHDEGFKFGQPSRPARETDDRNMFVDQSQRSDSFSQEFDKHAGLMMPTTDQTMPIL